MVVSGNGNELTPPAILQWQEDGRVECHCIAPGEPMQNELIALPPGEPPTHLQPGPGRTTEQTGSSHERERVEGKLVSRARASRSRQKAINRQCPDGFGGSVLAFVWMPVPGS